MGAEVTADARGHLKRQQLEIDLRIWTQLNWLHIIWHSYMAGLGTDLRLRCCSWWSPWSTVQAMASCNGIIPSWYSFNPEEQRFRDDFVVLNISCTDMFKHCAVVLLHPRGKAMRTGWIWVIVSRALLRLLIVGALVTWAIYTQGQLQWRKQLLRMFGPELIRINSLIH